MKVSVKILTRSGMKEAKGYAVGPFVVHRVPNHFFGGLGIIHKWGVTHAEIGASAATGPTKSCCLHAARRLRDVGADWVFTDMEEVKSFKKSILKKIRVICDACARGGYA